MNRKRNFIPGKWTEIDRIDQIDRNGPKWTESIIIDRNGPNGPKLTEIEASGSK